ncbi:DUF397 domain-containing protein [Actinokineospora inagensis]|uniref:DUF397 domain-containing protein n=1 Tax=Actinokineospora inagensis TaxID=103730 RepID=UPI000A06BCCD
MTANHSPTVVEVDGYGRRWAKSSASNEGDTNCVELAREQKGVRVRTSYNRPGGSIRFPYHSWRIFLGAVTGSQQSSEIGQDQDQ